MMLRATEMNGGEQIGRGLLERAGIDADGSEPWVPQIHDRRLWDRVISQREIGLGEAYMDGWFDVEQLDELLVRVMLADLRSQIRPSPSLLAIAARAAVANRQTLARAKQNAEAHYDIGNDLYEAMLDKRMIYTCAYWANATDLDEAQLAKLELICSKLHLEPGMTLLDIGCGWGGFAHYAAANHGVKVTGISPAYEQVKLARERCADLDVSIIQADYREVTGRFDRVVSIGMLEHVGPRNYKTFFDVCWNRLADDGLMLHHTIGSNESKNRTDPWFDKYIFPGGVLPSVEQLGKAAAPRWSLEDLHNFGPDYDRTLMAWSANISACWDDLPAYDERFRRMWHYYLMGSAAAFRVRSLQLWQTVWSKTPQRRGTYRAIR